MSYYTVDFSVYLQTHNAVAYCPPAIPPRPMGGITSPNGKHSDAARHNQLYRLTIRGTYVPDTTCTVQQKHDTRHLHTMISPGPGGVPPFLLGTRAASVLPSASVPSSSIPVVYHQIKTALQQDWTCTTWPRWQLAFRR